MDVFLSAQFLFLSSCLLFFSDIILNWKLLHVFILRPLNVTVLSLHVLFLYEQSTFVYVEQVFCVQLITFSIISK